MTTINSIILLTIIIFVAGLYYVKSKNTIQEEGIEVDVDPNFIVDGVSNAELMKLGLSPFVLTERGIEKVALSKTEDGSLVEIIEENYEAIYSAIEYNIFKYDMKNKISTNNYIIDDEAIIDLLVSEFGLSENSQFAKFYLNNKQFNYHQKSNKEVESSTSSDIEEIYILYSIFQNNIKRNFWRNEYPNILDKYLRISSISSGHSYFYDIKTEEVYDVKWQDMDNFMNDKLKPRWNSFFKESAKAQDDFIYSYRGK